MRRLDIIGVLRSSAEAYWVRRAALARALAVPGGALVVVALAYPLMPEEPWAEGLLIVASWLITAMVANSVQRVVLYGPAALSNQWGLAWGRREVLFLLYGLAILLALGALLILSLLLVRAVPSDWLSGWFPAASTAVAYYIAVRLSLVFPAIAEGGRPRVDHGWKASADNGWRVVLCLTVPAALVSALGYGLDALQQPESSLVPVQIVVSALHVVALGFGFGCLAVTHRELVGASEVAAA